MRTRIGGDVITTLPDLTELEILKAGKTETIDNKTGQWLQVKAQGNTGWVFGGFTSGTKPDVKIVGNVMLRIVYIDRIPGIQLQPYYENSVYREPLRICFSNLISA